MYLSKLQKYILLECYFNSGKIYLLDNLIKFYSGKPPKNAKRIITKSLEKMVNKGLLSVVAKKTPHKLFIREIGLTKFGKKNSQRNFRE